MKTKWNVKDLESQRSKNMNCKEYATMIYLEALDLKEQVDECYYQANASLLRKHCLKMRHDLNILNQKLGRYNHNEEDDEIVMRG